MGYARKNLICLNDTPYYHVMSRCVRRAWLCGFDTYTQRDYSHRKAWVIDRLTRLASVFAIDVCAYAVMSNHYHLVLHVDRKRAQGWSDQEVIDRWTRVFRTPLTVQRWQDGEATQVEVEMARELVARWRQRLSDVSWFMRCMNEYLARRANSEDECTGRFWQGRFNSQALLDEAGLLTAMAYVDLNPVRAGIAESPEEAEFTSIYTRIKEMRAASKSRSSVRQPKLLPFRDQARTHMPALPVRFRDYLDLVDWSCRRVKQDQSGPIDSRVPPILERLKIDPDVWSQSMRVRGNVFGRAMGRLDRMRLHARLLGQARIRGLTQASRLFTIA
jgi:REP element-mobilizing transposase RayT